MSGSGWNVVRGYPLERDPLGRDPLGLVWGWNCTTVMYHYNQQNLFCFVKSGNNCKVFRFVNLISLPSYSLGSCDDELLDAGMGAG